jgi:hypothetical protein
LISHPGSKNGNKRGGEKKSVIPPVPVPFIVATNISKLKIILEKKKILANFRRIIVLVFPKKWPLSSQKYEFGIRDPGKPIQILDPGFKKAGTLILIMPYSTVSCKKYWKIFLTSECRFFLLAFFIRFILG